MHNFQSSCNVVIWNESKRLTTANESLNGLISENQVADNDLLIVIRRFDATIVFGLNNLIVAVLEVLTKYVETNSMSY